MKVKLSHKDFILLIGILVAAVIAFSTWMRKDSTEKSSVAQPQLKKETLNTTTSMILGHLMEKVKPQPPVIGIR
ncbi:MAG: hypothetical protein C0523_02925 [Cytophaga sp.]|nr:hypothetical protein [Cytophaga sp.]